MLQNILFAMQNISDQMKSNFQPGGELTEPSGTNKTQNLTMVEAHF